MSALNDIIERDFFPDLPKMRLHVAYNDAMKEQDYARAQQIRNEYYQLKRAEWMRQQGPFLSIVNSHLLQVSEFLCET